jgi:sugar/nucleoside kinase (ribokinase family)
MSLLVVGSIAFDDVETPFGKATNAPGGSALYFSAAASLFVPVKMVGVVGNDFDFSLIEFLKYRRVDVEGIQKEQGKTFRWGGKYHQNMNHRDTLYTHLNVFETFNPKIPNQYLRSKNIFLANIDPDLQLKVLNSMISPKLTVLDTMNFWISNKRDSLERVIKKADSLILNDQEIMQLTGKVQIIEGAKFLLQQGPTAIIVKRGEHGALLVSKDDLFLAPAFPVSRVVDPTGAGDSFAGGVVGYLASKRKLSKEVWRKAVIYGNMVASFSVEAFSFEKLKLINRNDLENRMEKFKEMIRF